MKHNQNEMEGTVDGSLRFTTNNCERLGWLHETYRSEGTPTTKLEIINTKKQSMTDQHPLTEEVIEEITRTGYIDYDNYSADDLRATADWQLEAAVSAVFADLRHAILDCSIA